jgi:hypothetical protein
MKKLFLTAISLCLLSGCVAPRLGKKAVRYDNIERASTPENTFIEIYDSREDVPFPFKVIAEVQAAPPRAERDFGHDPILILKSQARKLGGIALLEVRSGEDHDSRNVWKGKVIARRQ